MLLIYLICHQLLNENGLFAEHHENLNHSRIVFVFVHELLDDMGETESISSLQHFCRVIEKPWKNTGRDRIQTQRYIVTCHKTNEFMIAKTIKSSVVAINKFINNNHGLLYGTGCFVEKEDGVVYSFCKILIMLVRKNPIMKLPIGSIVVF